MKSAISNPERKCGLPAASIYVLLVIPFGAKAQGANLGRFPTAEQPWPSPPIGNGPAVLEPVVVAPTSNALACRRVSRRFQCWFRNEAVVVHGPAFSFTCACAPRT